jgi:hypothetical protein
MSGLWGILKVSLADIANHKVLASRTLLLYLLAAASHSKLPQTVSGIGLLILQGIGSARMIRGGPSVLSGRVAVDNTANT